MYIILFIHTYSIYLAICHDYWDQEIHYESPLTTTMSESMIVHMLSASSVTEIF